MNAPAIHAGLFRLTRAFVGSLDKFSADYMDDRNQPEQQEREGLFA